eukprot:2193735-Amphidinium_carterae.1
MWWDLWKQHAVEDEPLLATPPPEIDLQKLNRVLTQYPKNKSPGGDGWNIRYWSLSPRPYFVRLRDVMALWERSADLPDSLTTLVALIPKPESTEFRPIAKTAGLLRAWSKLRRQDAERWERSVMLPSHWSGQDKGCNRAMWEHSIRIQAARAQGQETLSLFLDLKKFFDCVGHDAMRVSLEEADFPTYLWRSCAALYSGPRCLEWSGCIGRIDRPTGTVLPGCAIASAVVKVLLLPLLRHLEKEWPLMSITLVFDDLGLEASGEPEGIEQGFVQAARYIVNWLTERGASQIVEALSARQLGIAAQCGRRRCAWLHAKRQRVASRRVARLRRMRARASIARTVRACHSASVVWGSEIQ